jgi:hypothetical protein
MSILAALTPDALAPFFDTVTLARGAEARHHYVRGLETVLTLRPLRLTSTG